MPHSNTKLTVIRKLDQGDHRGLIGRVIDEVPNGVFEVEFIYSNGEVVIDFVRNFEIMPPDTELTSFENNEYRLWIAEHGHTSSHCNKCGLPNLDV